MAFQEFWSLLQSRLKNGTEVPNWTAARGLLGDAFRVTSVMPRQVTVETAGAEHTQKISSSDFKAVYDVWSSYCEGSVRREQIRDMTRYSKYVISILHWLREQNSGELP